MNTNKDFYKSALYFGLLMAGAFILIDMIFYVFDFSGIGMLLGMLLFLIFLTLYLIFFITAGRSYRNKYMGGYMTYGKAIFYCLVMALVYLMVMFVYQVLFYNLFDPERAISEMQKAAEMIQENSYIPEEAKEKALQRISSGNSNSIVFQNLLNNVITTIIIGAIAALFIRKKEKINEVF